MKKMYIYDNFNKTGETTFFFDDKKLITAIDGNDGNYRSEYMDCLFENFGVKVIHSKKLNRTQNKDYLKYIKDNQIEEHIEEKQATSKKFDFYAVLIPRAFGYQDVMFFIDKKLKNAKDLIDLINRIVKNNKDQYDAITEFRVNYFFKDKALELLQDGQGNYLTSRKTMSERVKVLEIKIPSKGFKSIKTNEDFWKYIEFNDKIESQALVVEKFE